MRRGCTGAQCAWRLWCEGQRSRRELLIPCASILLLPSDGCPQACAEAYLLASRKARANTSRVAVALFSRAHDPAKAPFRPVYLVKLGLPPRYYLRRTPRSSASRMNAQERRGAGEPARVPAGGSSARSER